MSQFLRQTRLLFVHYTRLECRELERLITAFLFAATILLIFVFATGGGQEGESPPLILGEACLAGFLALQIALSRSIEAESRDQIFDLIKTYPVSAEAWFAAKYLFTAALGFFIFVPTMILAALFFSGAWLLHYELILIAALVVSALAAVGVLLSVMTLGAANKQILYPILYFPLVAPVLLAAVESGRLCTNEGMSLIPLLGSWLGLLVVFNLVYGTLGFLLYGILVKSES